MQAAALLDLAHLHVATSDYPTADSLFRDVLATRRALYGPTHSKVADALNNLGNLLYDQGDYDAAEPLLRETLTTRQQLFGRDHPAVSEALKTWRSSPMPGATMLRPTRSCVPRSVS